MILLISAVYSPEPIMSATVTNDLAITLSDIWKIKVITPKPSRPYGFPFKEGLNKNRKFEQIILNSYTCHESKLFGRVRESYNFGKCAVKFIRENRTEIRCVYINAWPLLAQYLIVKAANKYSIPIVMHIQDI